MKQIALYAVCWISLSSYLGAEHVLPPITALTFTPDESSVIVGSQAGLEGRSLRDLKLTRRLATELVNIHDMAFSPDGSCLIAVGGTPGELGVIEQFAWPSGELLRRSKPHDDLVFGISWRNDSAEFATASMDRRVMIHDRSGAKPPKILEGHSRGVLAVVYLPLESGLLTASIDESLRLWNPSEETLLRTLTNHTRPVIDLALRPQLSQGPPMVVSVASDKTVRLWQPTIGRLMRFVRLKAVPLAVTWSTDGQYVLAACKDGRVRVIDPDSVAVLHDLPAIEGDVYCLASSKDGRVVVGGSDGQVICLKTPLVHSKE